MDYLFKFHNFLLSGFFLKFNTNLSNHLNYSCLQEFIFESFHHMRCELFTGYGHKSSYNQTIDFILVNPKIKQDILHRVNLINK